jgi:hypothetical protein
MAVRPSYGGLGCATLIYMIYAKDERGVGSLILKQLLPYSANSATPLDAAQATSRVLSLSDGNNYASISTPWMVTV